ncbi:hypothetical protein Tco_0839119 [Tanacetum coccineum]|uniref:Uncharacterized protein n=1 Tax=Tanacetum coccineum TaxID=301880 RepID=A0ABQ5ASJ6_9ASTR
MYKERHRDLARSYTSRKSVAPVRNIILVYPDSDEEDEEIGAENLIKTKHEVPNRCDDKKVGITDYDDSDQEDGELPDFPINVFVEDVKMDENHDIDHSTTKEALQWSLRKDPFLVLMEPRDQSNVVQQITLSSISNEVKARRVVLGLNLATEKHFKSGLVGYHAEDDDGMFFIVDVARGSRLGAWLRTCFQDMALPPRAEMHLWLRFDAQDYTDVNIHNFEDILARIFDRQIHRVQVLDFDVLTEEMDQAMIDRLKMEHTDAHGQVVFTSHAWRQLFRIRRPLVKELILEFFSTCRFKDILGLHNEEDVDNDSFRAYGAETLRIKEPLRRLCHRLISFSIAGRGQAPKKVTTTDLFFLRSMDEGIPMNIPYLLAQYLFRFSSGRKHRARMFGGHFITHLGVRRLVTWVATGLERQKVFAAAGGAHIDPKVAQEGVQADPAPAEAAQMPQTVASTPRRVGDRL